MSAPGLSDDAMRRLLEAADALSELLDVREIGGVIARAVTSAMGAATAGVTLLSEDGERLDTIATVGYDGVELRQMQGLPVGGAAPWAETARTGEPIWLESDDEWRQRYPEAAAASPFQHEFEARVSVPLKARGQVIGTLTFSFIQPRTFGETEQAFALALAAQCAQALDRARLYEGERLARASAEAQRARLEAIFEAAPARIAMARGPEHIYEFANSRYRQYLQDKDIIGKPAREVFPGAEEQGIIAVVDRVYQTGEPFVASEQQFWDDHDGDGIPEEHYFNVAILPVRDVDGVIDGIMLFTVDVTEQVLARRQIEELQRQKDDFLAAVSHDLRTPLTTIKGLAQMSLRRVSRLEGEDAEQLSESLGRIDATASKMSRQIGRLLDLTRMELNEPLLLAPSRFDLLDLLREAVAEAQVSTGYHHVVLETELGSLRGTWDAQRIERVVANLLSNAIKYSPDGGKVLIEARRVAGPEGERAVITVTDQGIGIPEEAQAQVFDRFYRAPNVLPSMPGAGLGLTGVRHIVEQHGGAISVRSRLGEGSTFEVWLPLEQAAADGRRRTG